MSEVMSLLVAQSLKFSRFDSNVTRSFGSRKSIVSAMEKPKIHPQIIAALIATLATMNGGLHVGWVSPSLAKLQASDADLPITPDQGSWIASCFRIGGGLGSLIAGMLLVNRYGRRRTLLVTTAPSTIAWVIIGLATNYWLLILARLIAGIGYGIASAVLPMYIGEIADKRIRGALGVLINQMLSIGILLSYSICPWVSRVEFASVGVSVPIIFGLLFFWMPESPFFLVMKKRFQDAEESLLWFRGTACVKTELSMIRENVAHDQRNAGTFKELIATQGNRKALMIMSLLMLAPQLSGVSAILAYTSFIFKASGSKLSSSVSVIIIGIIQFLSGGLSVFTVDLLGRRPLMIFSITGSTVFLIAKALYFHLQANGTDVSSISWFPMVGIVGYMLCYATGLGSLPFAMISEIFPCNVKAIASMMAVMILSVSSMAVTKLYQVIADAYGIYAAFWAFAVCSIFTGLSMYLILPETKQRSLRDIHDKLCNITRQSSEETGKADSLL